MPLVITKYDHHFISLNSMRVRIFLIKTYAGFNRYLKFILSAINTATCKTEVAGSNPNCR